MRSSVPVLQTLPTDGSPLDVPSTLLESFLPGFGIIRRLLAASLGIDITLFITTLFILFAFTGSIRYVTNSLFSFCQAWLVSTVTINSADKLYEEVMQWIAKQTLTEDARMLSASTKVTTKGAKNPQPSSSDPSTLHYGAWYASNPPAFTPYFGTHFFWHKGRLFMFKRNQVRANDLSFLNGGGGSEEERETISLSCLGRSSTPVKQLIMLCKENYADARRSMTTIRYASTMRGYHWATATTRPSRSIDTVYMDEKVKKDLLQDVYEFLHPSSPKFYASRGIPYRRGLLFYGPPGTGKTSLSLALSGIFGLELHVLSLVEPTMTDQKLSMLFSSLPARCIVLLEDIDTAGLKFRRSNELGNEADKKDNQETAVAEKPRRNRGGMGWTDDGGEVSLSGLLNALDGVASQEGRILIMTTNDPESLDKALIRPGRVDMQVYFGHLNKHNTRQVFVRMFTPDAKVSTPQLIGGELSKRAAELEKGTVGDSIDTDQLEKMADQFADAIPEDTFTPAEIQGFLLTRRKSPQRALDEIAGWRDEMLAAKARGTNIIKAKSDNLDTDIVNGISTPPVIVNAIRE